MTNTSASSQNAEAIAQAARWLATTPDDRKPHPVVPHIRRKFGLTPIEVVEAIREASLIRARSH